MRNFENPLQFGNITSFLDAILNVVVIISIPITILFLILAGFHYVTARGNPEKIQDASKSLLYGIIGAVIIIGSSAILAIVEDTVNQF